MSNYLAEKYSRRNEFTTLAVKHNAVNLGQGFIDYDPPKYHMDIYDQTVNEHKTALYQYTRGFVKFLFKICLIELIRID